MGHKTLISFDLRKYVECIATACSECTTKHKNKVSYNTDYTVLYLIQFWAMIEKRSEHRFKKNIFIFVKTIVLTKN